MSSTATVLKTEKIDDLVQRVRRKLGKDADSAESFVRSFYGPVSPDDMSGASLENLLGAALALWNFSKERKPKERKTRVYNPTLEQHGWQSHHTVIELVNPDSPFLVDSVANELMTRDLDVHVLIHPVVNVRRNVKGRLTELQRACSGDDGLKPESWMHIQIDQLATDEELQALRVSIEEILEYVRAAVCDWKEMRSKNRELIQQLETDPPKIIDQEELEEAREFLRWVDSNYFIYLGYREYRLQSRKGSQFVVPIEDSGLGILRTLLPSALERSKTPLSRPAVRYARRKNLLLVTKAQSKSPVHRSVHMDYVGVKTFDAKGNVNGEKRFLGLFTSVAYRYSAREIPFLRKKFERTVQRSGLSPDSHDGKALVHILESYPRDELFQISEDELFDAAMGILQLQERQRLALFVRRDTFENFVSCQVYVPKDRYETGLRRRIQLVLEKTFNGEIQATYSHLDDSPLARWHYIVRTHPGELPSYEVKQIESHLAEMARTWGDRLRDVLVRKFGEQKGLQLLKRYHEAFPTAYAEEFGVETALADVEAIEEVLVSGEVNLNLYRSVELSMSQVKFKVYHRGNIPLSGIIPILENMGLKVVSEIPYALRVSDVDEACWIRDFELASLDDRDIDLGGVRQNFQGTFAQVWRNEAENDSLNRLVVRAGLSCREVVLLRGYLKFLLQAGVTFSQPYMAQTLFNHPRLTRLLVDIFKACYDPDAGTMREESVLKLQNEIKKELENVRSLDEDRIIRRFKDLIRCTLRTNFFQFDETGQPKPYISFKLDSKRVLELPEPRMSYEIFVYSPRFEAIHLRGGKVARGGIRWSDRREDFRTEVLGLVKAQMVKNAVIVPVGAKGGFVVKGEFDRQERLRQGLDCYRMMVRGLLDITDNMVGGEVVPPPRVVRGQGEGDDPYLVVAADKGTATFSDFANEVAAEYNFWLGDAFASGGSAGYDHKKMGITAKGAFVSVRRLFRELGVDIDKDEVTVVGIGDMSGDVFGNGVLESDRFKLVGAFNHLHIFVDPQPDPEASSRERRRLFDQVGGWDQYDKSTISQGGGVFDRSVRSIDISAQMQELLGIEEERLTPGELIKAMLRAPVDLLWFGGIGTFVKASGERQFEADDRANDDVRVNADELRCRVIGEGANLGLTQRARIEYALAGGRINTDFIDNSGGVDVSDHEVNIKLLFGEVMADGHMTRVQRDQLLEEMTDDAAKLVLRDNYLQSQAISVAEHLAPIRVDRQRQLMEYLEEKGKLDREIEFLPSPEDLARRERAGQPLTRPEIAVLLAYAKIDLFDKLMNSDLTDDPLLVEDLLLYFPEQLRERFRSYIEKHRLRREIIATYATNSMVNRVGPTFFVFMKKATGLDGADIARAYIITRDVFGLRRLWEGIEELDYKISSDVQTKWIIQIGDLVERSTRWFLHNRPHPLDISANVKEFSRQVGLLAEALESILPQEDLLKLNQRRKECEAQGIPEDLARRLARIESVGSANDIVQLATISERSVEEVGRIYFQLCDRFRTRWLRGRAADLSVASNWQKEASTAIVEQIFEQQAALTYCVLENNGMGVAGWLASRASAVRRADDVLGRIRAAASVDLNMLTVAVHQLRLLVRS